VHKRIIPPVKRIEFVRDKMSYMILRGHWCDTIALNVHASTDDKIDDVKDSFHQELERAFDKFFKYHMKILLGGFIAKVDREDIFKPKLDKKSLNEISNDNDNGIVNSATSKNWIVKSTMLSYSNIHKFIWTSPDGRIHNQIDHSLIGRR
jgi:hypothetical protein